MREDNWRWDNERGEVGMTAAGAIVIVVTCGLIVAVLLGSALAMAGSIAWEWISPTLEMVK